MAVDEQYVRQLFETVRRHIDRNRWTGFPTPRPLFVRARNMARAKSDRRRSR